MHKSRRFHVLYVGSSPRHGFERFLIIDRLESAVGATRSIELHEGAIRETGQQAAAWLNEDERAEPLVLAMLRDATRDTSSD